ncbi:hypothetical protein CAPTEDRAFT_209354 [Capitella teleta]|uniref:Uncharacterized protein n=1 Tax=Capitella teleta TaxID=283909 RepID=R7TM10_CAPTE|nr:hypothetical protein CAPTEDRAFT_209354 [Capitella teleta]|eukprot:ELT94694.1 hypothetical protein CAPTEDRAFT_209354 [Capitella teleta]
MSSYSTGPTDAMPTTGTTWDTNNATQTSTIHALMTQDITAWYTFALISLNVVLLVGFVLNLVTAIAYVKSPLLSRGKPIHQLIFNRTAGDVITCLASQSFVLLLYTDAEQRYIVGRKFQCIASMAGMMISISTRDDDGSDPDYPIGLNTMIGFVTLLNILLSIMVNIAKRITGTMSAFQVMTKSSQRQIKSTRSEMKIVRIVFLAVDVLFLTWIPHNTLANVAESYVSKQQTPPFGLVLGWHMTNKPRRFRNFCGSFDLFPAEQRMSLDCLESVWPLREQESVSLLT